MGKYTFYISYHDVHVKRRAVKLSVSRLALKIVVMARQEAIRIFVTQSLEQETTEKLIDLAEGAVASLVIQTFARKD